MRVGGEVQVRGDVNGPALLEQVRAWAHLLGFSQIGVSDVDLTGHGDLVARTRGTGELWVIPGSSTGFKAPISIAGGGSEYDLVG